MVCCFQVSRYGCVLACLLCSVSGAWELDESPAEAQDWGYRPAEAAVAEVNPPSFTWRPDETAAAYDLEIAGDAGFERITYSAPGLPWSAHCPDQALAPGSYHWRYRGVDADGNASGWSKTRAFTVPEDCVAFPMPTRADLVGRIPAEHPRLFIDTAEVVRLRGLADGPLAARWRELVKQADKLLANPPDTSEPPKYPEGTERKGKEWRRIWWGNRTHGIKAADAAATLAFVYRLSGDRRYGEAARAILLAVCAWDPKGATNYRYNDEAAMPLLYLPSRAYTWAYDMFTPEERERVAAVMRVRGEDCYNSLRGRKHLWRPYSSHHNRAWHKLGELATVFYDVIPEASEWLEYGMTIFYTCYPVWGDADGGWHEGQAYWLSYLSRFLYWALAMDIPYGINAFEKPFFKHAGDFGLYSCPPGTETGAFGDLAQNSASGKIASFMGQMAAVADNPYWVWYAAQHGDNGPGGYFGFLTAARERTVEVRPPDTLPSSKAFRGTGLAVLNSRLTEGKDNVQIHFKSSPFGTQSHGYNANNAFLLNLRGERTLIQSGSRDIYGSPHHEKWMWQTKSDNAILVNGEGQFPHTVKSQGRITHFHTDGAFDLVAGEAGGSYANLDRWARRIFFFKPGVILIHDVLEAPEAATFQWLLHAKHPFALGDRTLRLEADTGKLDLEFLKPAGLAFSQTSVFDPPPHEWANLTLEEWHFTAATQTPEKFMEFITVIRVDGVDASVSMTEEGDGTALSLALADNTARVLLQKERFQVHHGTLDTTWEDNEDDRKF